MPKAKLMIHPLCDNISSDISLMFFKTGKDTSSHSVYKLKIYHLSHVLFPQPLNPIHVQILYMEIFSHDISQVSLHFYISLLLVPTLVQVTIISYVNYFNNLLPGPYNQPGTHRPRNLFTMFISIDIIILQKYLQIELSNICKKNCTP